jgi:hypothetical protein
MPFGKEPVMRMANDTTLLAGSSGDSQFALYSPGSPIRYTQKLPVQAAPVTQALVDSYLASVTANASPLAQFEVDRIQSAWEEKRLPSTLPTVRDIVVDDQGRMWVNVVSTGARLIRKPWGKEIIEQGDSVQTIVVQDGEPVASIFMPAHKRLVAVHGERVVAVLMDSNQVETLEILELEER